MLKSGRVFAILSPLLIGAGLLLFSSCGTTTRVAVVPPEIPGAHYVGNSACYDCHTNITRVFNASPHARLHFDDAKLKGESGCESCHGPGSLHIQAGGGRGKFIANPGKDPASCFNCHLDIQAAFSLPQHHPVPEHKMNCIQCHDPHGPDIFKAGSGLAMARQNETCASCHREQTRPFVFEHEAMREGCATCHNPHGSPNRKLLVESDPNLCLKCHAQTPGPAGEIFIGKISHTLLLRQGTCWSAGCHTAIHGSNLHPRMLF